MPGTIDVGGEAPPPQTIRLRDARVAGLLGAPIARERCAEILSALEFAPAEAADGLDVTVPPFRRNDVTREADLIEEVARIDGLDKLPATLPSRHGAYGRLTRRQRLRRRAADALVAQGLEEVVGWSFTGPDTAARFRVPDNHPAAIELDNPLSREQSLLRTTLVPSLLDVASHNRAHGATTLRLFEAGAVYLPEESGELPREPYDIAALLIGPIRPPTWREPEPRPADFFAVKGVVQGLLAALGVPLEVRPAHAPFVHPGRAGSVWIAGEPAGWLGELHPLVAAEWAIDTPVAAFEINLDAVPEPPTALYEDLTSFPEVREDLAVVVSEDVSAAQVIQTVKRSGAPLLGSVEVFDVYRDPERIGEGNVSLALRLSYRAADRTLTDEEVARQREAISAALVGELSGRVRAR